MFGIGTEFIINLAGAIALLLIGLRQVNKNIQQIFGGKLRQHLRHLKPKIPAVLTGVGLSLLMQSSTASVLLLVSFVEMGAISVYAGLLAALGADVGVALAARIMSFGSGQLAPLFLILGEIIFRSSKQKATKYLGRLISSIGIIMLALLFISSASSDIREADIIKNIFNSLESDLFLSFLVAILFTVITWSSMATIIMIGGLSATGLISPTLGLIMVAGVNVGAAVPAFVSGPNAKSKARIVTLGNLIFRSIGGLVAFIVLVNVSHYIKHWPYSGYDLIFGFHILLNIIFCAVGYVFAQPLSNSLEKRYVTEEPVKKDEYKATWLKYDKEMESRTMLLSATQETRHMADMVFSMLDKLQDGFNDSAILDEMKNTEKEIIFLHRAITSYISQISKRFEDEDILSKNMWIFTYCTNLYQASDILSNSIVNNIKHMHKYKREFSNEGQEEIMRLYNKLLHNFVLSKEVFDSGDLELSAYLIEEKRIFREDILRSQELHAERLLGGIEKSQKTSRLHMGIISDFRRINSHLAAIAYINIQD